MFKLLAVFVTALILAYISEKNTEAITASGQRYTVWKDWAYIALVVILVLFSGLRTSYNDSLLSSKIQKNLSEKWHFFKNAAFFDFFEVPVFSRNVANPNFA